MLTLFHAPQSRSSAIITLIDDMGIADWVNIQTVTIPRQDGSGHRDPANPHPEGKVPVLVHDGHIITERGAIILHLTTLFPDAGFAPPVGTADWGAFAGWLTWYHAVMEPVLVLQYAGVDHPLVGITFRGHAEIAARLRTTLEKGPWLMGDQFTAADLLIHSPYAWFQDATPNDPLIRDWVARCMARPSRQRTLAADALAQGQIMAA